MGLLLLPVKALGWILATVVETALRVLVTLATIGAVIGIIYWLGGRNAI